MSGEIGKRIRQCRRLKALTLEELGNKSEICSKYLGEIERGKKNPTLSIIRKIANGLDIHPSWLLSEDSEGNFEYMVSINRILSGRNTKTLGKVLDVLKIVFEERKL